MITSARIQINTYFRNEENKVGWHIFTDEFENIHIQFMEFDPECGWINSEKDADYPIELVEKISHIMALFKLRVNKQRCMDIINQ